MTVHEPASLPAPSSAGTWRDQAACLHYDPDRWFPETIQGPAHIRTATAIQICQSECPATSREACDRFADETNQTIGVWGGISQKDRADRRIARARKTAALKRAEDRRA